MSVDDAGDDKLIAKQQKRDKASERERLVGFTELDRLMSEGAFHLWTDNQRAQYVLDLCDAQGLDPRTQPFKWLVLDGKLQPYLSKGGTDQLRRVNNLSTELIEEGFFKMPSVDGTMRISTIYYVKLKVYSRETDREQIGVGATHLGFIEAGKGLSGVDLANGIMKTFCVPLNSEILTKVGFKQYDQLSIGELVASYNLDTNQLEWVPLENVTVHDSLPMWHMQNRDIDVYCSENHSWVVNRATPYRIRSTGQRKIRGAYQNRQPQIQIMPIEQIPSNCRIIITAPEMGTDSLLTSMEAALLGWAVTDGTIQTSGKIGVSQSKEQHFAAIKEIVYAISPDASEVISKPTTRTFPRGNTYECLPQHWWYLPTQISRDLLKKVGFKTREDLPAIVMQLSNAARAAMLQAFMLAEGGDDFTVFYNSDPILLETFQLLATLQGYALGKPKFKENGFKGIYTQKLRSSKQIAIQFLNITKAEAMPAWCPTTKHGTWVMRQNGCIMITGNTKAERRATISYCGLGMLDDSELENVPRAQVMDSSASAARTPQPARVGPAPMAALPPKPNASTTLQNAPGQAIPAFNEPTAQSVLKPAPNASQAATVPSGVKPDIVHTPANSIPQIISNIPQMPKPTTQTLGGLKPPLPPIKPPVRK